MIRHRRKEDDMETVLIPLGALIILGGLGFYFASQERKAANTWETLTEGVYDHVEYRCYEYSRRSGAMVHHTSHYKMEVTAIYLEDGRCLTGSGRADAPFSKGTKVRILRSGDNRIRIERV